jgi:hypothetical protein
MKTFKEYISLLENPTDSWLTEPVQNIFAGVKEPSIEGNIKNSEKPPCSRKISIKKFKKLLMQNL